MVVRRYVDYVALAAVRDTVYIKIDTKITGRKVRTTL
jgi:hypothetical protein